MADKEKHKKDDWIRLASKSRPGRFYLFNKATGETQWLPIKQGKEYEGPQKLESPPKLSINKVSNTPAQDRLKRLQHTLKASQIKPRSTHNIRHASDVEAKTLKEQENECKDEPSTSASAKRLKKSPKKATKRPQSDSLKKEMDNSTNMKSSEDNSKKLRFSDSLKDKPSSTTSIVSAIPETFSEISQSSNNLMSNNKVGNVKNMEDSNNSKLNNLRTGIVRKIKEICKMPFNVSKKKAEEKLLSKEEKCNLNNTTEFKAARKFKDKHCLSTSVAQKAIVDQIREEKAISKRVKTPANLLKNDIPKSPNILTPTNSTEFSTPKNLNIPSYSRGSANSRLERLKQSLLSQQQQQTLNTSAEANCIKTTSMQMEEQHNITQNTSTTSLNHSTDNTINDEVEAMDWQTSVKEDVAIEVNTIKPTLVIEKSKKLLLKKLDANENQTMGDIIDTVNENLLRFSAEKQKDPRSNYRKWRKEFYYFVVDTNVLLKDLTFVEDLTKMKLCDTKGSMLYIPYAVLQELDKLKMRSGCQEGVKTLAVRAIKYLNTKFENNSLHLQAQSALDERHRLVDINSADDSIMNCCLQAKERVPNLLLLTEDVNLRNKAICNNILVSTKSDLLAKRYDLDDAHDNHKS